jgi:hypothetical protein
MKRRDFITLLGGAMSWPLAARAAGKRPRGAVLTLLSPQDERGRIVAFIAGMRALGHNWHLTTVRCDAPIWSLLEAKRTCRKRWKRVDLTKMTQSGHEPA